MMDTVRERHNRRQEEYFSRGLKTTMVPRVSPYLERHVREVLRVGGFSRSERLLEVGCGMGRYTLLLARLGYRVEGLDLTPALLERLREYAGPSHEIPLHVADVADPPRHLVGQFDGVLGLFMLHHVHDLSACFSGIARLLKPGGRAVFLEPNAFNPLFYLQIAFTPGMTWEGDGGVRHMRRRKLFTALSRAGFTDLLLERFGFANTSVGSRLERTLESFPAWRSLLPFQLVQGRRA
jgi:SAM-dependent methyltransferase